MNHNAAIALPGEEQVFHSTFSIERTYPQSPSRVFFAHANEAMKRRWLAEGEGWEVFEFKVDFRLGGAETSRFAFRGGPDIYGAGRLFRRCERRLGPRGRLPRASGKAGRGIAGIHIVGAYNHLEPSW